MWPGNKSWGCRFCDTQKHTAGELGDNNEQLLKIAIDHIFGNIQFISSDDNIKEIYIPEESLKQQLIRDRIFIK